MSPGHFDTLLPGIQLAVFEVLWPVTGLMRILIRATPQNCDVHFQLVHALSEQDREACEHLMAEILEVAFESEDVASRFFFGPTVLDDATGFQEVMSDAIFKQIASEVAPWRLNQTKDNQT